MEDWQKLTLDSSSSCLLRSSSETWSCCLALARAALALSSSWLECCRSKFSFVRRAFNELASFSCLQRETTRIGFTINVEFQIQSTHFLAPRKGSTLYITWLLWTDGFSTKLYWKIIIILLKFGNSLLLMLNPVDCLIKVLDNVLGNKLLKKSMFLPCEIVNLSL